MLLWFFHVTIFLLLSFTFMPIEWINRTEQMHLSSDNISWYDKNYKEWFIINFTGLVIPLPAVIMFLTVEDYKYSIHRFPPTVCISNGPMWFYSVTVIIDMLVGVSIVTYLLVVFFWIIHNVNLLFYKLYGYSQGESSYCNVFVYSLFYIYFSTQCHCYS